MVFATVAAVLAATGCSRGGSGPGMVEAAVREKFPEVQRVSTAELADEMVQKTTPVLLDVREPAEYAVSHLQGARQVQPDAQAADLADLPKDAAIVTYCSVGYRSAGLAQRLRAAGFTRVRNLEGSIFRWASEGRPVYRDGVEVTKVHPYNAIWGRLLRKDLRAPLSSD